MGFEHASLPASALSPAIAKFAGPQATPPMRMMAARGLAPLLPRDLLIVLYQFWVNQEPPLAEEAAKTVAGLPVGIVTGALDDPTLPAGVLDFVGRKLTRQDAVLERIVRHPQVHDQTLVGLARTCSESICDLLSENERRWLGCPGIVESLYQNPKCRMSVVHRMLELAVRQGMELKLPNMEEIRTALFEGSAPDPERDKVFAAVTGQEVSEAHERFVDTVQQSSPELAVDLDTVRDSVEPEFDLDEWLAHTPADDLLLPLEADAPAEPPEPKDEVTPEGPRGDRVTQIAKLTTMEKIRLALLGTAFERSVLIRDSNKAVCMSAIKSPRVKENEAMAYASNRALNLEVIRFISRRRDWIKLYQVKYNLVFNPKTPIAAAMTFLSHLHAHDVRKVARSRNIPSVLAQAAKRRAAQRN